MNTTEEMVECPYNKAHRMLRKRLQRHLMKCRINYPDIELQKCPFNQIHLIPEPEFVNHVTNCPDRKLLTQYQYNAPPPEDEDRVKQEPIECDENWDDEDAEDYDPKKYLATAKVLRKPEGETRSERRAFIIQERKRLGDYNSSDEEREQRAKVKKSGLDHSKSSKKEHDYKYASKRPSTPPAPSNISWSQDASGCSKQSEHHTGSYVNRRRPKSPGSRVQDNSKEPKHRNNESAYYDFDDDPYYKG